MAKQNKNINTLAHEDDDDPTAELEILSEALASSMADEEEAPIEEEPIAEAPAGMGLIWSAR